MKFFSYFQVQAIVNRCARLKLKVNAEAPILILPRKTTCADLLIANLGKLNIENQFLYASNNKTNASNFQANRFRTGVEDDEGMYILLRNEIDLLNDDKNL